MTMYGKLISLFPLLNISLVILAVLSFIWEPSVLSAIMVPVVIYVFPLVCFHLHQSIMPLTEGRSSLTAGYSAWFGTHMLQDMFIRFPVFERLLRLIPGAFSVWLRLWGSNIGERVYWVPQFELTDRSLLDVGDNTIFGYGVQIGAHFVRPSKDGGLEVYVKRVSIGSNVFVGAGSRFTPGVVVEDGVFLNARSDLYPNKKVRKELPKKAKVKSTESVS